MTALRVGIVGCGLMGRRRAAALDGDELVACTDPHEDSAQALAEEFGGKAVPGIADLLAERPDAVIVASTPDSLAELTCTALAAGAGVLVEKPAGVDGRDVERIAVASDRFQGVVKVGLNHRYFPGIARAIELARSGEFGELLYIRGRYGHGGRQGYGQEWRADRRRSGGGELVDQGMHLIDISHALLGRLPLHSALLTRQFWGTSVDENAVVTLSSGAPDSPWALLHVSWTEWKNLFSLEIFCRAAKLQVDGLVRSYGRQRLRIYRMGRELGPPQVEETLFPEEDTSFRDEWASFRAALHRGPQTPPSASLEDIRYAWEIVEDAYARAGWDAEEEATL